MKLLIITKRESDLLKIFGSVCKCTVISPAETVLPNFNEYDAMAILGGTEDKALILNGYLREKCEEFSKTGKPIFLEYVNSFACVYSAREISAVPHRLVSCDNLNSEILRGNLLDSRCNSYIHPHFLMPETKPILYYKQFTPAHNRLSDISDDDFEKDIAFFKSNNLLFAAFRMCDYIKANFSPKQSWNSLICYICEFLGIPSPISFPQSGPTLYKLSDDFQINLNGAINNALNLLRRYLVVADGSLGIKEGLFHNILPDGTRIQNKNVRADCSGEAAGAFMFSFDEDLIAIADNIFSYCYGPFMVKDGDFKGMMRWTEEAWNVCYQDDVARTIIPSLLYSYFGISDKYVQKAVDALDFLCRTTCKDGLRPARTDVLEYVKNGESVTTLAQQENGYACAHYNSWYSAALLLGYAVCGKEEFLEVGTKGLETLMSIYPNTIREHSETSEQCRMIFPLAVLYSITGEKKHYEMLRRVYKDLQEHKHPLGGYAEWDTGYKAVCFNQPNGECSLLSQNGDPVADMLYSINWLPLGFAFAYLVTGDEDFRESWEEICMFFAKTQIQSEDKLIDGAWCRGIDLNTNEYCGIPHDVGWGPCCMEIGWTVAEITMGMEIGKGIIEHRLHKKQM